MSHITLTVPAASELTDNPIVRQWQDGETNGKVPLLFYYNRCYSTPHDGTTVEHGDGFGLSLVDPDEVKPTEDIAVENTSIFNGNFILVRIPRSILTGNVSIGWSNGKFSLEPPTSS